MAKINSLKSILTLFFSFWVTVLFAQGDGSAGITEATSMVTSYFDPATKLIYAIGAIVGLIGGVKVYSKFSSGDPDTGKTAAAWFGACIFPDCCCHHPAFILPVKSMAEYFINKGVNKPAEFKGLQSQYLFIFAGGLLGTFVVFIVMYLAGINQWVCIFTGLVLAFVVVWLTFSLNRKFGRFGLMKHQATRTFPAG